MRQLLAYCLQNRESADTGVEYTYWQARVVHCVHACIVPKRDVVWNNPTVQKLIYAIAALVTLLIVIGLALPRNVRVVASEEIDARPATVFALVNDFHRASLWLPALESDPNARIVYSGPERGVGAALTWDGLVMGSGTQIITASQPYTHISTAINPGEPGAAKSWFDLVDRGPTTIVSWTFETDYGYNLVGRYAALLLVGVIREDYERGLRRLGDIAESLPRADFSDLEIEQLVVSSGAIAYLPTSSAPDPASMSAAMGKAYFQILNFIDEIGLSEAGAPMSIMRSFSGSELLFDAAIPVRGAIPEPAQDGAGVRIGKSYAGTVIRVKHVGSYRALAETHRKIAAYLAALGIVRDGAAWESYVSDPTKVAEADLLTYVYYPVLRAGP
jgi:effector-binding domain-containing protein